MRKIANYSAAIWAVSCYIFAFIIFYTTKMWTHDPNFSGGPETPWLLPMLSSIAIGGLSFGLMFLTGLISLIKKDKSEVKMPLNFNIKKSFLSVFLLGIIGVVFLIGVRNGNLGYKKSNYTGQQLFDAVNEYRVQNNKKAVPIALYMCDNLVARYLKIKSGDVGHEGFEEWAKNEQIDKKYIPRAELYVKDTYTTKDAIDFWNGSPGHRLALLQDDYDAGCAYANEGIGVIVFGSNLPK
ncbi:MAG: hypothetical protein WC489_01985 [Patescibacteria group bacterium]